MMMYVGLLQVSLNSAPFLLLTVNSHSDLPASNHQPTKMSPLCIYFYLSDNQFHLDARYNTKKKICCYFRFNRDFKNQILYGENMGFLPA